MTSIVDKLIHLGQTLSDKTINNKKKIKVLKTLEEIDLNLNELSSSGIGKAVKSLKNEPNELGSLSKSLIQKWKKILEEHLAKENIKIKEPKPQPVVKNNPIEKCVKLPDDDGSIDSSSGISFMDSLKVPVIPQKKKSLKRKPIELTTSSKIDVSLEPDYIKNRVKKSKSDLQQAEEIDPEFEAGNLKYKSKKILYAPRKPSNGESCQNNKVQSLVLNCVQVLANHIHQVDHVGNLPFEIFEKALTNISLADLRRIHKFNPQYNDELQPYWIKQAGKDYPLVNFNKIMKENPKLKPSDLYKKLERDCENKLEKFINRTSNKVKAEQNAQRTTLTVDAINPRNTQRKSFPLQSHSISRPARTNPTSSSSRTQGSQILIPKNMSHPDGTRGLLATKSLQNNKPKPGGDLLAKLRKKFR